MTFHFANMKISILYFAFHFMVCHCCDIKIPFVDPDTYRNVSELITCHGYPLEEHTVITEDGYILSMQRIPYGKNNHTEPRDKEVVLLIHGEVGDSKTWFLNPPGQGLGYVLPDAGYDVWMINCRGSTYSKKHVKYPVRSRRFWDWTFDEIAKYDATATIDYVLNATGKSALHVIGYSRGNTVGFVLLSEIPEYNEKVKLLVALAPIAYIGHFKTIARYAAPFAKPIAISINAVTQGEFLPTNKALRVIIAKFCELQDVDFCQNIIFAIAGQDRKLLNETRIPVYSAQYISSTSTKILVHFAQLYKSKKFRKYDNGPSKNLKEYNQLTPPDYDLSRITAPVAIFTSDNDIIADTTDVNILRRELKSLVYDFRDPDDQYNHFDYIWAKDAPEKINKPVLELLSQY